MTRFQAVRNLPNAKRCLFNPLKATFFSGQKSSSPPEFSPILPNAFLMPQEQALVQKQLDRCQYGLGWSWMEQKSPIHLQLAEGDVFFSNFRVDSGMNPNTPKSLKGDCLQLSLQVGKALAKELGNRYHFYLTKGNFSASPWQRHFFLVSWPKQLDAQIKETIQASPINHLNQKPLPKGTLVIDPTYNKIQRIEKEDLGTNPFLLSDPQGHILLEEASRAMVPHHHILNLDPQGKSLAVPLGFTHDAWPDYEDAADSVACLRFQQEEKHKSPQVRLMLTSSQKISEVPDWQTAVPKSTPLYQMLLSIAQKLPKQTT
jgi:hypothetical protein